MRRLRLQLRPGTRTAFGILNLLPLPGVGAMLAGQRNPHTRLLPRGVAQSLLVLFGLYPLLLPGLAGLAWAAWDAARILQADLVPLPPRLADAPAGTPK